MGRLVQMAIASLDGYVVDADGSFDWAEPDEEVLAHVNERVAGFGTHLYGRRTYDLMVAWEADPAAADLSPGSADFARLWQAADKVVFSRSLAAVTTRRTTLVRGFDPAAVAALRDLATTDVSISGPTLAAEAHRAGLVDQVELVLVPVSVGAGTPALPADLRLDLALTDQRRFADGTVALRYDVRHP